MTDVLGYGAAIFIASSASALFVVLSSCFHRRGGAGQSEIALLRSCGLGIGIVLVGGLAGHAALGLWPNWPAAGALDRFLCFGLPAAVCLELAVARLDKRPLLRVVLEFIGALLLCGLLVHGSVYVQNPLWEPMAIFGGSAAVLVLVHELSLRLGARAEFASLALTIAAVLGCSGVLIMMAGYLKGGSAALLWSAAAAGTALGVFAMRSRVDLRGVVGLEIIILFALVFIGHFFGRLSAASAVLLFLAPVSGWIVERRAFTSCNPWQKEVLRLALVFATLLVIMMIGKRKFDRELRPLLGVHRASCVGAKDIQVCLAENVRLVRG